MKWSDDFRHRRWLNNLQRSILLLLLCGFFLGMNALAPRFHFRSNWGRRQQLSPALIESTAKLSQPLEIHVLYYSENASQSQNELLESLQLFLENYRHGLEKRGKSLEFFQVNLSREPNYGLEILGESSPIVAGIYLRSGDQRQQISLENLKAAVENFSGDPPFWKLFAPALQRLAGEIQPIVYSVEGHGERSLQDSKTPQGLWRFGQWLNSQGIRVESLHLEALKSIDPGQNLLLIDHPQSIYDAREEAILETFLRENSGRLILLLPQSSAVVLEDLLFEWGTLPAWETLAKEKDRIDGADILVHDFDRHLEFIRPVAESGMAVKLNQPQMIRRDFGADRDDHRWVQPFLFARDHSSGEKNPESIPLGVAVEKRINPELSIQLPQGKLVVIGGDFLSNDRIQLRGNQLLFQQILQWLWEKSPVFTAESGESYQFALSRAEYYHLWRSLMTPPMLLALASFMRWFWRRRH